jgi:hypothetical protein
MPVAPSLRWLSPLASGLLLCLVVGFGLAESAFAANAEAPGWVTVGQGSYKRMFWHIYDAKLEALQPQFNFPETTPYALTLVYKLDLDVDELVDNTLAEWKKQKLEWQPEWVTALRKYLPAVHAGDSLSLEVNTDHSAAFLYNGKPVVTFTDPQFVNAFVGIWLSEHSDNLALRRQLLGLQK